MSGHGVYLAGMTDQDAPQTEPATARTLTPAAQRALDEAAARKEEQARLSAELEIPAESGGPKGLEPTRFGDWERKGMICDF